MKTMRRMIYMVLIFSIGLSACKKDSEDNGDVNPQTPSWLIPYQGTYTGTYEGDDFGTWKVTISNSDILTVEAYSALEDETYFIPGLISSDKTFSFSNSDISYTGIITDYCSVSGTWLNTIYNEQGTFEGWKEPVNTSSVLVRIEDKVLGRETIHEYDQSGRHIKTEVYDDNGSLINYATREWLADECIWTSYRGDGSVSYAYRNPYPFNSQGVTEYATYILYTNDYTRYDTCTYQYNQDGYMLHEDRQVTLVFLDNHTEQGTETRTYTYSGNNLIESVLDYQVGSESYNNISTYSYYNEYPNLQANLAQFLGKDSQNLIKQIIGNYENVQNTTWDYMYELFDVGLIKREYGQYSSGGNLYDIDRTYFYK